MYIDVCETDQETNERLKQLLERSMARYWKCKRIFDLVVCSVALLVLLPFMLLVAVIIVVDDPHGSPIFKQKRIGRPLICSNSALWWSTPKRSRGSWHPRMRWMGLYSRWPTIHG